MDRATLTMAMAAMADPKAHAGDIAKRLGITTTTLYAYLNGDGSLKLPGKPFLTRPDFRHSLSAFAVPLRPKPHHRRKWCFGSCVGGYWSHVWIDMLNTTLPTC